MTARAGRSRAGRPRINYDMMPARFPSGTFSRIDGVRAAREGRAEFLRRAVDREIALRKDGNAEMVGISTPDRRHGLLETAVRVSRMTSALLSDPEVDLLVGFPDATDSELREARVKAWKEILRLWGELRDAG